MRWTLATSNSVVRSSANARAPLGLTPVRWGAEGKGAGGAMGGGEDEGGETG